MRAAARKSPHACTKMLLMFWSLWAGAGHRRAHACSTAITGSTGGSTLNPYNPEKRQHRAPRSTITLITGSTGPRAAHPRDELCVEPVAGIAQLQEGAGVRSRAPARSPADELPLFEDQSLQRRQRARAHQPRCKGRRDGAQAGERLVRKAHPVQRVLIYNQGDICAKLKA